MNVCASIKWSGGFSRLPSARKPFSFVDPSSRSPAPIGWRLAATVSRSALSDLLSQLTWICSHPLYGSASVTVAHLQNSTICPVNDIHASWIPNSFWYSFPHRFQPHHKRRIPTALLIFIQVYELKEAVGIVSWKTLVNFPPPLRAAAIEITNSQVKLAASTTGCPHATGRCHHYHLRKIRMRIFPVEFLRHSRL